MDAILGPWCSRTCFTGLVLGLEQDTQVYIQRKLHGLWESDDDMPWWYYRQFCCLLGTTQNSLHQNLDHTGRSMNFRVRCLVILDVTSAQGPSSQSVGEPSMSDCTKIVPFLADYVTRYSPPTLCCGAMYSLFMRRRPILAVTAASISAFLTVSSDTKSFPAMEDEKVTLLLAVLPWWLGFLGSCSRFLTHQEVCFAPGQQEVTQDGLHHQKAST